MTRNSLIANYRKSRLDWIDQTIIFMFLIHHSQVVHPRAHFNEHTRIRSPNPYLFFGAIHPQGKHAHVRMYARTHTHTHISSTLLFQK